MMSGGDHQAGAPFFARASVPAIFARALFTPFRAGVVRALHPLSVYVICARAGRVVARRARHATHTGTGRWRRTALPGYHLRA